MPLQEKVCDDCGEAADAGGIYTAKQVLLDMGEDPDSLEVWKPEEIILVPCEVCGKPGAQLHHHGTQELFPDISEKYSTQWLCRVHHDLWHSRLDRPLRQLRKEREYIKKELRKLIERLEQSDETTA